METADYKSENMHLVRFTTAKQLARYCGVTVRTARRWRNNPASVPPPVVRLLAVLMGDLGLIWGDKWKGWRLDTDGDITTPQGEVIYHRNLRALPYILALNAEYEKMLRHGPLTQRPRHLQSVACTKSQRDTG